MPVFSWNYLCYVHNRVIVFLSKAKELKTCEQRFFTTFKMTRVLAVSLPLAPTGGVILCSVILTVGKDLKTAAKYL